ncbi:Cell division protein FtsK [hydrothermal vent metagenome]|uniref:Cell division protein FtsK n=1 Tax=hydrothermal vent metagenome TaxID=652676 RepID=A0A1W1DTK6_9ZZZZ
MVAFSAAILAQNTTDPAGGWIGEMMHGYFGTLFGSASFIVYLSIMMISFSIASTASWANIFNSTGGVLGAINKNNNSKKPVKNTINESNESLDERKDSIKARRKAQEEEEEEEQKRAHLKGLLKPNQERLEKEKAEKKKRDQILAAAAAAALALRLKKPEVFAPQGYRITDMKLTNKFFIEWTIYYIDESKPNEKKYFKASIGSKGINTGGTLFKFKWASPI